MAVYSSSKCQRQDINIFRRKCQEINKIFSTFFVLFFLVLRTRKVSLEIRDICIPWEHFPAPVYFVFSCFILL